MIVVLNHPLRGLLNFLFDKRTDPYIKYGEGSIGEGKFEITDNVNRVSGSVRKQADRWML